MIQVFQKGPQVTALVANLPGLHVRNSMELRQSLPTIKNRHGDYSKRPLEAKSSKELDFSSDSVSNGYKSRNKQKTQGFQLTRSTASLDCKQMQSQLQRRRPPRVESAMEHISKNRKSLSQVQPLDFDSEPTYYRQVFLKLYIYSLDYFNYIGHFD